MKDPKDTAGFAGPKSGHEDPARITGAIGTFHTGHVVIGTATLDPGDIETVSGMTVSVGKSASVVVVDGKTQHLSPGAAIIPSGEEPIATERSGNVVVGTATLEPGNVETISGTTISVGASWSYVVIDGENTQPFARRSQDPWYGQYICDQRFWKRHNWYSYISPW